MPISNFKDIVIWQKSHNLVLEIYKITQKFPKTEEFNLISQMRRSAVSIPSNIAEGFKRKTPKDKAHFTCIAQGSLSELMYQLLLSKDLGYIKQIQYDLIILLAVEIERMLNAWKKFS